MGLFNIQTVKPEPSAAIGAAASNRFVGDFLTYTTGFDRLAAINIPTISRARDLICSMVGALTIKQYQWQWVGDEYEKLYLPDDVWFDQPDPNVTRNFILSWTVDDMIFYGRAFWVVTKRFGNGFPAEFTWIPAADVQTRDQAGPQWFGPSKQITFNGMELDSRDVVQFLSPIQGLLTMGARTIRTARNLDESAERFARNQIPSGILRQTDGEPMSAEELANMAAAFADARESNAIAALNQYVTFEPQYVDPSKMQSVESREHQALEIARVANIPPYLVGIGTAGMTYQNAQQARQDLYLFGAKPYVDAIEQTLSMNNVTPRGRFIELDVESYLEENDMAGGDENAASAPSASRTQNGDNND
jgi:hypothetical protein